MRRSARTAPPSVPLTGHALAGGRGRTGVPGRLAAALVALGLACVAGAVAAQPGPPYRNNYPHADKASFLAWQWQRLRDGVPAAPPGGWAIPVTRTDPAQLRSPDTNPSVTWLGHATMLVRLAGQVLLFDPIFSDRASPLGFVGPRRAVPLPIDPAELPRVDLVMVSHNHYDHLDMATVQRLAAQPGGPPRFLVPAGLKPWFAELGITRVDEYRWWDSARAGALTVHFVPVQHWSRRRLDDTNATLWGGWVVEGEGLKLIHTGDTGYSQDFRDIGQRLGPFDLAFIPIGAYAPRWFMKTMHLDVPDAVQVRADLGAVRAIGMHWGTFEGLTDEPLDEPPQWLARQRAEQGLQPAQFDVMAIGETRRIERVVGR